MTTEAMTEAERKAFLSSLNLSDESPGLVAELPDDGTVENKKKGKQPKVAPVGIDPRMMPVSEIEFDPKLLDAFDSLNGPDMKAASEYVFAIYKSQGRNKDRNGLLHRRISEFIAQVRIERRSGGAVKAKPVTERIKANAEERDLARLIAASGITVEDLAALLANK